MGQTLTHGIYLPDEGERNCYSGLAANWQLLDGAVGTIAEHTTALAGKAPAVHTHTKNDITDFPAYGNAAGTICEGNDSRLSDARTPVAHTHTKSDVTDLLNSNFIPSANNSYDLGSSSYQWNNLYAKNYYYNGTAWGLDKANTWTNTQTYAAVSYGEIIRLKDTGLDLSVNGNTGLSSTYQHMIQWVDNNNTSYSTIQSWTSNSENVIVLRSRYRTDANTVRASSIRNQCTATSKRWYPESNGDTDLGTSTNKWKTLNGINPGALSLPDNSKSAAVDTTNWDVAGGTNTYTPPANGWLHIRVTGATELMVRWDDWRFGDRRVSATATDLGVTIPVVAGVTVGVITVASGFNGKCQFFPCLGNV